MTTTVRLTPRALAAAGRAARVQARQHRGCGAPGSG
eukprot:CAMPEP_0174932896 /NCGR_PEP_ID=MMETSP1355-20121228/42452_1 /TAXON_ID=464990 /ORGANISM="Hemiselmis tepida, Strain CCMP443" /LENGTH=35 /DNA_ID= /DNA_START= /DNA_END= /DNA_ORIENTATION=